MEPSLEIIVTVVIFSFYFVVIVSIVLYACGSERKSTKSIQDMESSHQQVRSISIMIENVP